MYDNDCLFLTFICLRATTLSYDLRTVPSYRDVRTLSTAFRVDLGTRYVTMCGVSLVAGRSEGKRYTTRCMERGLWGGGVGKQ
jgi:hypothetical protein